MKNVRKEFQKINIKKLLTDNKIVKNTKNSK